MALSLYHCSATLVLIILVHFHRLVGGQVIGVNYGLQGNNLPTPQQAIDLCKSKNINIIRIFNPDHGVLAALQNSGIELVLGTENTDLPSLAQSQPSANQWVETNVKPFYPSVKFRYLSIGNEVIPSNLSQYVLPAMQNIKTALSNSPNLSGIPVTTSVFLSVLGTSYPPSKAQFSDEAAPILTPIVQFLETNKYPLLCNVYPSFAYSADPKTVRLDYALFNTTEVVVKDGTLGYTNMFDAMVDAVYWALESAGGPNVRVVASETGWPSDGDNGEMASIQNAETYNNNLIAHVKSGNGTPKKAKQGIEAYVFALFNENLKPAGTEQHWGLFYPDMTEVYPVKF